jgi:mRNA interferase MazF
VNRGEIWTVAGGGTYASKPRRVVIIRADSFAQFDTVTFVPLTSFPGEILGSRVTVDPADSNGPRHRSWLMIEKIASVSSAKLRRQVGMLDDAAMIRLGEAMTVYLGLSR